MKTSILIFTSILGAFIFIYPSSFENSDNNTLSVIQFIKSGVETVVVYWQFSVIVKERLLMLY